jgi:hypothetical protein
MSIGKPEKAMITAMPLAVCRDSAVPLAIVGQAHETEIDIKRRGKVE